MKILLVTAVYQRHELTEIVLDYYRNMKLDRLAIGSEGEVSRKLVEKCGWNYMEFPNAPLSYKFSALFNQAREFNPEAVLLMGSDDLISDKLINYYQANYHAEAEHLMGLKDLYFYHVKKKRMIHHQGFIGLKSHLTIGCGRIFSRRLLDKINWDPWGAERTNRGLDLTCSRRLTLQGIKEKQTTMFEAGIAVDIKTDMGLTKMETFNFNFTEQSAAILDVTFPAQMSKIKSLSLTNDISRT